MQALQWPILRVRPAPAAPKVTTAVQKVTKDGNPFPVDALKAIGRCFLARQVSGQDIRSLRFSLRRIILRSFLANTAAADRRWPWPWASTAYWGFAQVVLVGQPDVAQITTGFAQQLLTCIQAYPTLLSRLAPPEMALLARVLANVLGRDFVLAEVKSIQNSDKWLSKVKSPEDEKKWKRTSDVQLSLLGRAVELATKEPWD